MAKNLVMANLPGVDHNGFIRKQRIDTCKISDKSARITCIYRNIVPYPVSSDMTENSI